MSQSSLCHDYPWVNGLTVSQPVVRSRLLGDIPNIRHGFTTRTVASHPVPSKAST